MVCAEGKREIGQEEVAGGERDAAAAGSCVPPPQSPSSPPAPHCLLGGAIFEHSAKGSELRLTLDPSLGQAGFHRAPHCRLFRLNPTVRLLDPQGM